MFGKKTVIGTAAISIPYDYKMFSSGGKAELPNKEQRDRMLSYGVEVNEHGLIELNDDFEMKECHFCKKVDFTMVYEYLGENIYCCNSCKSKMEMNDDDATMTFVDMIFKAEKFAKKEKVAREIESIITVFAESIRKYMVGDKKSLIDIYNIIQAVGTKDSIQELIHSGILNKKEIGYLKADIATFENQIENEEKGKLEDKSEEEDDNDISNW